MSVIIVFPDQSDWLVTSREFHRLMVRCESWFPEDAAMRNDLSSIMAYNFIGLGEGEPRTSRVLKSLRRIAKRTISELTHGGTMVPQDPAGKHDCLRVYGNLLTMVERALTSENSDRK